MAFQFNVKSAQLKAGYTDLIKDIKYRMDGKMVPPRGVGSVQTVCPAVLGRVRVPESVDAPLSARQ